MKQFDTQATICQANPLAQKSSAESDIGQSRQDIVTEQEQRKPRFFQEERIKQEQLVALKPDISKQKFGFSKHATPKSTLQPSALDFDPRIVRPKGRSITKKIDVMGNYPQTSSRTSNISLGSTGGQDLRSSSMDLSYSGNIQSGLNMQQSSALGRPHGLQRTAQQLIGLPTSAISEVMGSQHTTPAHIIVPPGLQQAPPANVNIGISTQQPDDQPEPMNISSGNLWSTGQDDSKRGGGNL